MTVVPVNADFACVPMAGESGRLIRFGQFLDGGGFGNYEHAEVKVNNTQTMGARPGGAALDSIPPLVWQKDWLWSTGRIKLTDARRVKIVQTALSLKGTPYSAADYFAIAAHRLHVPDPGGSLQKYISDSKHMICSQLVDYCYMIAGVHLFSDGRWPGFVTPADLANVILHPESIVYA